MGVFPFLAHHLTLTGRMPHICEKMSIAQDVCTTCVTYVAIPPGRMPHIRDIQLLLALATKLRDLPLFRFHKYAPQPLLLSLQPQLRATRTCALCSGRCRTATYVVITASNSKHRKLGYTKEVDREHKCCDGCTKCYRDAERCRDKGSKCGRMWRT